MLTIIRNLALIPKLIRAIGFAVATVEAVTAPDVPGEKKKQLVIAGLNDVLGEFKGHLSESFYEFISVGIDVIVKLFNLLQIFGKGRETSITDPETMKPVGVAVAQVEEGIKEERLKDAELEAFLARFDR